MLGVSLAAGCALPGSEYSAGTTRVDAGVEARTEGADAGDGAVAVDAAIDAGVVDLLGGIGSFESGRCGEESSFFQGTGADDPSGRAGSAHACRVCRNPGQPYYTLDHYLPQPPVLGARYHASVWVRAVPEATTSQSVIFFLREYDNGPSGFVSVDQSQTDLTPIDQTWRRLELERTVTHTVDGMDVFVSADPGSVPAATTTCFLVDDLVVWQVAP